MIAAALQRRAARPGRPDAASLTPEEEISLAQWMVTANVARDAVSVRMATWAWAEKHRPDLLALLRGYSTKHTLPECIQRVARMVRGRAGVARDARRIGSIGVLEGGMRMGTQGRLRTGQRISIDDVTANSACWVPWPQGGDRCSDRYGVRLGRWQTLIAHDDASNYVPLYVSAVRWAQTYRGEDACSAVTGFCRTVCRPDQFALEGGVWQGGRVLSALEVMGVGVLDVKGRPNHKLVEGWINPFHTRMAIEMLGRGQVGRFRGEEKAGGEIYCKCREGKADPRLHFPAQSDLLDATDRAIAWLNNDRVESKVYGKWIPAERWAADMAAHPRQPVSADEVPEWATAPVLETRIARRGQVVATAGGADGDSRRYTFCAPELVGWEGRSVRVAFDPFYPDAGAEIVMTDRPAVICRADWTGAAARNGAAAVKALREGVRREMRVLLPGMPVRREVLVREQEGTDRTDRTEGTDRGKVEPVRDWAAEAEENEAFLRRGGLVIPGA